MDLGVCAHLAAIKSRIPFIHFSGFRTSHEIQKISAIEYDELGGIDMNAVKEFRSRALNPEHPAARGHRPESIYFRAGSVKPSIMPAGIVEQCLKDIGRITGKTMACLTITGRRMRK